MFRTLLLSVIFIVSLGCVLSYQLREGLDCPAEQIAQKQPDYKDYCESDPAHAMGRTCNRTGATICVDNAGYLPINDPSLKTSISTVRTSCGNAINAAVALGDVVDDPMAFPPRQDNAKEIKSELDSLIAELGKHESQAIAIKSIAAKQAYCDLKNQTYQDWQNQLNQIQQAPCKTEATIQLPGSTDILNSATTNSAALKDILTSLEARLSIIEKNLQDNEVTIRNTKYNELIIDDSDPQTFDFSLPNSTPIVSIVGTKPQKLRFVLPKGPVGVPGKSGDGGPNFSGPLATGLRGPQGEVSHYSGLPEQWYPIT
jgi:hypothetical protein